MLGLEIFIGGDVSGLQSALRDANYQIKGFISQNKMALQNIEKLGAPASIAFAGLTLGIAQTVKTFGDFEATLNRVQAVSNATASEMAAMKAQAIQLGVETKFTGQEAAEGMEELVKAGFSAQQTMAALPGVLQLAAAGGVSVADAATLAAGTIREFNLQASDTGKIADVMAQAANQSSVDISDLQDALKYAGTAGAAANQSIEQVAAALAVMGNSMIKGDMAGTTLRELFVRLQAPPAEAAAAIDKLKLSVATTTGQMLPLSDIIEQLREKTANMTDVQRNATIAAIAGQRALGGVLALVRTAPGDYDAMLSAMEHSQGVAKQMSDTINSGFNGSMHQLVSSGQAAATMFGDQLAPAIEGVAGILKDAVNAFTALPAPIQAVAAAGTAGGTALTGLVGAAGLLLPVLKNIRTALFLTDAALGPVGLAFLGIAAAITLATAAAAAFRSSTQDTSGQLQGEQNSLNALIAQYDALSSNVHKTTAEKERLRQVLDQIQRISPDLVTSYDAMGNATEVDRAAVDKLNASLREQLSLLDQANQAKLQDAVANRDRARYQLYASQQQIDKLQSQIGYSGSETAPGQVYSGIDPEMRRQLEDRLKFQQAQAQQFAEQVRQAEADVLRLSGDSGPKPSAAAPTPAPYVPPAPSAAEASKAASQAHQEELKQLQALQAEYQRLTEVSQAWGGGTAAEVKNLKAFIVDAKKNGLDKFAEGQQAIIEAQTRLNVIQGETVTKAKALSKTQADDKADEVISGQVNGWLAVFQAIGKVNDADKKRAAEMKKNFHDAVTGVEGDLLSLASDPSAQRIGDIIQGFATDSNKIKQMGDAFAELQKDFKNAGGGADGFGAAIGDIVKNINPLSIGLTALVGVIGAVKNAFDQANQAAQQLSALKDQLSSEAEQQRIDLIQDPVQQAKAQHDFDVAQLQQKLSDNLKQANKLQQQSNPLVNLWDSVTGQQPNDHAQGIDAFPKLKQWYNEQVAGIEDKYNKALADAKAATDKNASDAASAAQRSLADTLQKASDAAKQVADAQQQLTAGGTDDWGHPITLEAEKQLKLSQQQTQNQQQLAQLEQQRVSLNQQLTDLNNQEASDILAVQNQGIAVRQMSEAQDKATQIAKIQKDAADKRASLTDQINQNEADIANAQLTGEQAVSRITIQYDQQIKQLQQQLTTNQQILATQLQIASLNGGASAASYNPGIVGSTQTINGQSYVASSYEASNGVINWQRAAGGGEVFGGIPGKDSVPTLLTPGEVVMDTPTTRGIKAMFRALAPGGGVPMIPASARTIGGYAQSMQVNVGSINIQAAPGQSPQDISNQVWNDFQTRLRRTGLLGKGA